MTKHTITVPDIGGSDAAEVVEILVAVGDEVSIDQGLLVLESDKASMEIPADAAGALVELLVKEGDQLAEGAPVAVLALTDASAVPDVAESSDEDATSKSDDPASAPGETGSLDGQSAQTAGATLLTVNVPAIGTDEAVDLIELEIEPGQVVSEGDTLVVLESDKASMDVPAPESGTVRELLVSAGAQVKEGDPLLVLEVAGTIAAPTQKPAESSPSPQTQSGAVAPAAIPAAPTPAAAAPAKASSSERAGSTGGSTVDSSGDGYAGPAVRKLAREFGVPLAAVRGTGPRGRILKEDLHSFVQQALEAPSGSSASLAIAEIPDIDYSKFGAVEVVERSRLDKLTAENMQRSWLSVPHVTQFDDADITDMEAFRRSLKGEADARGSKLTPLPFLLKAVAVALKANPKINSSLSDGGSTLTFKQYVHVGMAVDTPAGLVVPVVRDVDQKSVWELADEVMELAGKARDRKLKPVEMQGAGFTISSLGAIGGRGFTPIVNTPEVAILGVGRADTQPVWNGESFAPRKLLPLSLSYDHRVVNGGDAGRFLTALCDILKDMRRAIL
ncbi:MAG: dihydrolipoyllysine-residue acetyltransferase [Pseudomonadota bacterium]